MGTRQAPGWGLLLIDERLSASTEAAQGSGTLESAYTEAGPRPGLPVPSDTTSAWRASMGTYQDQALQSFVLRAGFPGQDRTGRPSTSVAVRVSPSSAETDYQGWDDPVTVSGWTSTSSLFGPSAAVDAVAATVIPTTQELILLTCASAGGSRHVARWDPRKEVWSETSGVLAGVTLTTPIALGYDSERGNLILWAGNGAANSGDTVAYYSRDKGATWAFYSAGLYDQTTLAGRCTVACPPQRSWSMLRCASGGYGQFASADHGASWQRVDSASSVWSGSQGRIAALGSGAFLVVYIEATTLDLKAVRLPNANIRIQDIPAVTISNVNKDSFAVACDADGVVYVVATDNTAKTIHNVFRSLDEGVTWERYIWEANGANNATYYATLAHAFSTAGELSVVHQVTGVSDLSDSIGVLRLGGWSSVEGGNGETGVVSRTERIGFGAYTTSSAGAGRGWYPLGLPQDIGWTRTNTGSTVAWSGSLGAGLAVTTTAAEQNYYQYTDGSHRVLAAQCQVTVDSGTNTTGGSGPRMVLTLGKATGTAYEYAIHVSFSSTTIRVEDRNGTLDTVSGTLSTLATTGVWVRAQLTQDNAGTAFASVAYRVAGSRTWTILVDRASVTADATPTATADSLAWGHVGLSAATSTWRHVGAAYGGDWTWGIEDANDLADQPWDEGHLGLRWGRALPTATAPYPCPLGAVTTYTTGSPTSCPRIFGVGGPSRVSETTTLPLAHTQPLDNIYPAEVPSPERYWQSTGTSEAKVVWDLGSAQWLGDALGLVVLGGYGRQVALEYYDGSAWVTAGTLDLSLSAGTALNSTLSGSVLTPRAGTTEITRYLTEGELVGGYVILSAGAGYVGRRITRQSAGYWSASAHQPTRLTLEGVDGTEDASGTADLIAPGGVLVAYPTTAQARRYWRVRWTAAQVTPGSVYRAGVVGVGRVIGIGAEPGWGWSRSTAYAREVIRDRAGRVRSIRRLGDPGEVLSYDWAEGVDLYALRSSRTPDYVAVSGGLAIGSAEDAVSLAGYVEQALASGEVPCVVLPRLPQATGTITDPSLYLYGLVASDEASISGVDGTEGSNEYVRVSGLAFERVR